MVAVDTCGHNRDRYVISYGFAPVSPNYTQSELFHFRQIIERHCDPVQNNEVLVELVKLNRQGLRVFAKERRNKQTEVGALVAAIWSLKLPCQPFPDPTLRKVLFNASRKKKTSKRALRKNLRNKNPSAKSSKRRSGNVRHRKRLS